MKEEKAVKLFHGVNGIGDDLIEEAGMVPVRKREKVSLWRWGAAAACLCLVLAGTASAVAGAAGVNIRWMGDVPGARQEDRSNYKVTDEGLILYPLSCFSEEVLVLGEEPDENGWHSGEAYFQTWEELEQFVGLEIYDDPVLDEARPGPGINGKESQLLHTGGYGENMQSVLTFGTYRIEDIDVDVRTATYTEVSRREKPYVAEGFEEQYEAYQDAVAFIGNDAVQEEIYVTQCGAPATIMRFDARYGTRFSGFLILNGSLVIVEANTGSMGYTHETLPDDTAHVLEVLKTVLDGFQL